MGYTHITLRGLAMKIRLKDAANAIYTGSDIRAGTFVVTLDEGLVNEKGTYRPFKVAVRVPGKATTAQEAIENLSVMPYNAKNGKGGIRFRLPKLDKGERVRFNVTATMSPVRAAILLAYWSGLDMPACVDETIASEELAACGIDVKDNGTGNANDRSINDALQTV